MILLCPVGAGIPAVAGKVSRKSQTGYQKLSPVQSSVRQKSRESSAFGNGAGKVLGIPPQIIRELQINQ